MRTSFPLETATARQYESAIKQLESRNVSQSQNRYTRSRAAKETPMHGIVSTRQRDIEKWHAVRWFTV